MAVTDICDHGYDVAYTCIHRCCCGIESIVEVGVGNTAGQGHLQTRRVNSAGIAVPTGSQYVRSDSLSRDIPLRS